MIAILKNRHVRDTSFQAGFVGALIILIVALVVTGKSNLEAQGLTSGFDFLERSTGWRISFSLIDYTTSSPYWLALVVGLLNSVFLGAISLSFATFIGVAVGVMRTSGNGMAELIGTTFVEIFRNVPLILQLLFWYSLLLSLPSPRDAEPILGAFAFTGRGIYIPGLNITGLSFFLIVLALVAGASVSLWLSTADRFKAASVAVRRKWKFYAWIVTAIVVIATIWWGRLPETAFFSIPEHRGLNYREGIRVSPELFACIIAISIYGAAYIAEIIRSGFNAIPAGQGEAGHALGLSRWQIFTRIRLPLAIRIVMPTLINQYVWLFKATTIGIAISFTDFFMVVSTAINQSGQTLELIAILMGGFLVINYSIAWVLNRVNDAIKLKGTQLRI